MKKLMGAAVVVSCVVLAGWSPVADSKKGGGSPRTTLPLDGMWMIAEGQLDRIPTTFDRTVPVPGLVDMAQPAFIEPGPMVANRKHTRQKDPRRDAFWYRRTFSIPGTVPAVAVLKVGKAMFGTRVILNGQPVGDHAPCFTPGFFDVGTALKTGDNELIIRVGADRNDPSVISGSDREKLRYVPGIFDSVELILSGTPHIENLQVAPDLSQQRAKVRVYLKGDGGGDVTVEIREAQSGKIAGQAVVRAKPVAEQELDLAVPIASARWWTPEDPFLYQITVRTSGDEFKTRFGMREFKFDQASGRAMLNGNPYFMRGSNITLYRFFEDSARGNLPWNREWVRTLHKRTKEMNWNCLRYSIGFPPEFWYEIADEEGILIQDEFPIWFSRSNWPAELTSGQVAKEFAEWLRERWNHPCVVIWDASNETIAEQLGVAIRAVRGLDLSDRPWDNSHNPPQKPGDCFETHPYHFHSHNPKFRLADLAGADPTGENVYYHNLIDNTGRNARVVNEYGWLWLNRDGTPTVLTREFYQNLLGTNSTPAERFQIQARYLAADTEFWRAHRKMAAVMHFSMLGYSRPNGQTSDHWQDVKNLTWEREFLDWMPDAFAPVGLMINCFEAKGPVIPVILINDRGTPWYGPVAMKISRNGKLFSEQILEGKMAGYGRSTVEFPVTWPEDGEIQVEARLTGADEKSVRSRRIFQVRPPVRNPEDLNARAP